MKLVVTEILTKQRLPVPFSSLIGKVSSKLLLQMLRSYGVTFKAPTKSEMIRTFAWLVLARDNLQVILKKQLGLNLAKLDVKSVDDLADLILDYFELEYCH